MNEQLRRAVDSLRAGLSEIQAAETTQEVRSTLRRTVEDVLTHLEAEDEPEDLMSGLDRQSRSIAEDLRRAERLMRERTNGG